MDPFKDCDVRGVYPDEVNEDLAYRLGRAVAEMAEPGDAAVAGDVRLSTASLKVALTDGLISGGREVVDLGAAPTPLFYFEMRRLGIPAGVMVTGSHNPPNYNGFKPRLGPLPPTCDDLLRLKALCVADLPARPKGHLVEAHNPEPYLAARAERFAGLTPRKVAVDSGNGAVSDLAPRLFRRLGCDVIELYCEPDGNFPNRSPNTSDAQCLEALSAAVRENAAELGLAFDGDGDRVVVMLPDGAAARPDPLTALLAKRLLRDAPGRAVVHDTRCSNVVPEVVRDAGGVPVASRSGHTALETAMLSEKAAFGAEISGHYFFDELAGTDDGLFAGALILSLLSEWGSLADRLAELPSYLTLPEIRIPWNFHREAELAALRDGLEAETTVSTLDGVRADWSDGWGIARASVTEPMITFRFEGRDEAGLGRATERFVRLLSPQLRSELSARLAALRRCRAR